MFNLSERVEEQWSVCLPLGFRDACLFSGLWNLSLKRMIMVWLKTRLHVWGQCGVTSLVETTDRLLGREIEKPDRKTQKSGARERASIRLLRIVWPLDAT